MESRASCPLAHTPPRSKGAVFPHVRLSLRRSLLTRNGVPTAPADVAHGQDALPKVRKLHTRNVLPSGMMEA
jgi:hypothetical protein